MNDAVPVIVAELPDGTQLPVVDTTHPAFHVDETPAALSRLREKIAAPSASPPQSGGAMPSGSIPDLLRRMFAPSTPFLDGLATYLLKLGPNALPARFDTEIERRLISSPNATSLRLRLQQIASLMAGALRDAPPRCPIRLISIGGGTGIDSLNAMIVAANDGSVEGRRFKIDVLDLSDEGIAFGRAALAAVVAPSGPLAGLQGSLGYCPYSWNEPEALANLFEPNSEDFVLASSEGALFEYGSDEAICANLKCLRECGDIPIAGSVIRNDAAGQAMVARSPFPLQAHGLTGLERLARKSGYRIAAAIEGIASDQFLLCVQ